MNLNEQINIERRQNGDYLITWTEAFSESPVKIYAAETPESAPDGELVYSGDSGSARIDSLREPVRHYFHLAPESGSGITYGERAMAVPGGNNLRDLGGYLTDDGRQVQWGKLYRSGRLSIADAAYRTYLANLGIKLNCDLRHARDFARAANTLPENVTSLNYPIDAGSFDSFFDNLEEHQLNEAWMVEVMRDINRQMVKDYQQEYRGMFGALLALEDGGFLVNCTAGKDRTGFASALILHTLGVPKSTILYDYELSKRYFKVDEAKAQSLKSKYSPRALAIMESGVTRPLAEVRAEYLQTAFDTMAELSGSLDQFIEDVYGVGAQQRALLRERYTR